MMNLYFTIKCLLLVDPLTTSCMKGLIKDREETTQQMSILFIQYAVNKSITSTLLFKMNRYIVLETKTRDR